MAAIPGWSGQQVALLRHADGWRLVAVDSRADGDIAQTETEARAWAARVLEIQAKISHRQAQSIPGAPFTVPAWAPGPTPGPGVTTLYADA